MDAVCDGLTYKSSHHHHHISGIGVGVEIVIWFGSPFEAWRACEGCLPTPPAKRQHETLWDPKASVYGGHEQITIKEGLHSHKQGQNRKLACIKLYVIIYMHRCKIRNKFYNWKRKCNASLVHKIRLRTGDVCAWCSICRPSCSLGKRNIKVPDLPH